MSKEKTIDNYKLDYPEAARVIHLYLKGFCDESLNYPNMIADAARKASEEIDRLRVIIRAESNDAEQTLEQQITDYKNQEESIPLIFIDGDRIMLKVDSNGFISIDGQVVGHEPRLPKLIGHWKETNRRIMSLNPNEPYIPHETRRQLSEMESNKKGKGVVQCFAQEPTIKDSLIVEHKFDPSLPFEVSDRNGESWRTPANSSYVGQDKNGCHLLLIECPSGFELDEYQSFPRIRNVKKPEFNASMLENGQCIIVDDPAWPLWKDLVLMRNGTSLVCVHGHPHQIGINLAVSYNIKGRLVKIETKILPDENN